MIFSREKITMTEQEYKQVLEIIDRNMITIHENVTNLPRIVLTTRGFSQVKQELKALIKEKK